MVQNLLLRTTIRLKQPNSHKMLPLQEPEGDTSHLKSNTRESRSRRVGSVLSGGTPIVLTYEPLADTKSMKRLLADLTKWVLQRKIHHRLASTCRGLIETFIELDEHERLDDLERRIKELEVRKS